MEMTSWIVIPGGWGKYEASSSQGQIRNKNTGRVLKQRTTPDGFKTITLQPDSGGKQKTHFVHRLVAAAHLLQWGGSLTVDHINRQRSGNSLVNLRMATMKQQHGNRDKSNQN